jgi:hypothetical protein
LGEGVLSHGLPGHQIWPLYISFYGIHKGLSASIEDAKCGRTQQSNSCSLWHCCAGEAALDEGRSVVWTFVGPPEAQMWRSTEELQHLGTSYIFQCSFHVSVLISLGNIKCCYW